MKRCTPIHCSKMLEEKPTRPMEMWIRCRGGLSRGQEAPEGGGGGSGDVGRRYGSGEVWKLTKRGDPPRPQIRSLRGYSDRIIRPEGAG